MITQALTCAEQTGEDYAAAELHRIKGELLMKSSELESAGKCFADALAIARHQETRSWQLRAALSLHRLDLMLGNSQPAQLAEVYSFFTEGFETADVKQARELLDAIPVGTSVK